MDKKKNPDLKDIFKQAAEIAQQVPKNMQEAAFNKAVDLLTIGSQVIHTNSRATKKDYDGKQIKQTEKADTGSSYNDDLISLIDTTKHPEVKNAKKVLDKSLIILQIALKDHSIDGLTPSSIAKILTDKFRISTTNYAVSMALGKATNLVNRIPDGQGFIYKIMTPGEEYLSEKKALEISSDSLSNSKTKKKSIKKNNKVRSTRNVKKTTNKKRKGNSPVGIKESILSLIGSGYFNKGKTAPEIQVFLNNKRGINISTDQLRMAMLRLVRDEKLERDLNEEKQYEYTKS